MLHRAMRYRYLQPKIYAWKARLLTKDNYINLLECDDTDCFIKTLSGTVYEKYLKENIQSETDIERALYNAYIDFLNIFYKAASGNLQKIIESYLFELEFENYKTIARAYYTGIDFREIIPNINMRVEEVLKRRHLIALLLSSKSLKEFLNNLKKVIPIKLRLKYWQILTEVTQQDIVALEILLDIIFLKILTSVKNKIRLEDKKAQEIIAYKEDLLLTNTIYTLSKLDKSEILKSIYPLLPDGYYVSKKKMIKMEPQELLNYIKDKFKITDNDFEKIKHKIKEKMIIESYRTFYGKIFTLSNLIGIIELKKIELENLILILRSISLNIKDKIKEELIIF